MCLYACVQGGSECADRSVRDGREPHGCPYGRYRSGCAGERRGMGVCCVCVCACVRVSVPACRRTSLYAIPMHTNPAIGAYPTNRSHMKHWNTHTTQCVWDPSNVAGQAGTVDGQWSDWNPWTDCVGPCGTNQAFQSRTRSCDSPAPQFGGHPCPATDESMPCALSCSFHLLPFLSFLDLPFRSQFGGRLPTTVCLVRFHALSTFCLF